mmetsp:Transcript_55746/g.130063  ORF Transcript_55746/g.130063 Transcript_55746/m.130063 type:complete len:296 (-) Transcript_55746:510-1397(-)
MSSSMLTRPFTNKSKVTKPLPSRSKRRIKLSASITGTSSSCKVATKSSVCSASAISCSSSWPSPSSSIIRSRVRALAPALRRFSRSTSLVDFSRTRDVSRESCTMLAMTETSSPNVVISKKNPKKPAKGGYRKTTGLATWSAHCALVITCSSVRKVFGTEPKYWRLSNASKGAYSCQGSKVSFQTADWPITYCAQAATLQRNVKRIRTTQPKVFIVRVAFEIKASNCEEAFINRAARASLSKRKRRKAGSDLARLPVKANSSTNTIRTRMMSSTVRGSWKIPNRNVMNLIPSSAR